MDKVISTLVSVVIAVAASGAIFVGINLLFDQVMSGWRRFEGIVGALLGFCFTFILGANRLFANDGGGWTLLYALLGAVVFGGVLGAAAGIEDDSQRPLVAAAGFAGIGVLFGLLSADNAQPGLDIVGFLAFTVAGVVIGGGIATLRKRSPIRPALLVGAIGAAVGFWGTADSGGSMVEAMIAYAVPLALVGAWAGLQPIPDRDGRRQIEQGSRKYIFLAPALSFIVLGLLLPLLKTLYLSVYDRTGSDFVGLENFGEILTDDNSLDLSGWADIFTSRLTWFGLVILVAGILVGRINGRPLGVSFDATGASLGPIIAGATLFAFAVFTVLRGTVINNLWWVVTVVGLSTVLGLAIAVLADGARGENIMKSLIFMPLAISFVGAGIIWRLIYVARDASSDQTGVLNAVWVGIGKLSNNSGRFVISAILALIVAALVWRAIQSLQAGSTAGWVSSLVIMVAPLWLIYRFLGPGLGGFVTNSNGDVVADPILFIQDAPFNNFWLMIVLVWIQTGFAMVLLSAAIKAVPTEFTEAARVDGATENQIFWRVTMPQILPTIGVVVTTLILTVMKVFDIVRVMTNGSFGTEVLANDMFRTTFTDFNLGLGSALAITLFISVVPVMIYNIRTMQKERLG